MRGWAVRYYKPVDELRQIEGRANQIVSEAQLVIAGLRAARHKECRMMVEMMDAVLEEVRSEEATMAIVRIRESYQQLVNEYHGEA